MNHRHKVLTGVVAAVGLALVMALFTAGEQVSLAAGSIIYVDADATGAHDGTSWADAFTDLQPALDAAVSGDQIWVAEGTYTPTESHGGKGRRYRSFQLENGVAVYGGFDPSVGAVAWEDREWTDNQTILSGDLKGDDGPDFARNRDNSYHVFYHPAELGLAGTAILDGFTISGGNANHSDFPHNAGGGMYNVGASPTLTNCTFSGSWASIGGGMYNSEASAPTLTNNLFHGNSGNLGGGMANDNSSPVLTSCLFSGNSADGNSGGGMYNDGSSPSLTGCTFEENSASEGGGMRNVADSAPTLINCAFTRNSASYYGGGMDNGDASPILTDCTFEGNTSQYQGGGMSNFLSAAVITNVTFTGNSASTDGGGIYNSSSAPTLTNATFLDNSATYGGGMYNTNSSSPTLDHTTFTRNQAADGGGVYNIDSSAPVLTNCTFSDNLATWAGGGMQNISSSPIINDCIFQGNSAGISGGGVNNTDSSWPILTNTLFWGNTAENGGGMHNYASLPWLVNCTFANNTASYGGAIRNYGGANPVLTNAILWGNTPDQINGDLASVTYSDIQGGYSGTGNINTDPLFLDITTGDLHLSVYSPAIDMGNNSAAYLPTLDIDGDARILDGDFDGTAIVDMGVDETTYEPPPMVVYYVDQDATGENNGTSWADAFTTLQPALDAANRGDQIWVAAGTYRPTREFSPGDPRSACFQMKNNVAIYGGFAGSESSLDERNWTANLTIISGDLNGDDGEDFANYAENSYHVFYHAEGMSLNKSAILDGFTITGGNADNSTYPHSYGGGMYNNGSSPTLANCTFSRNLTVHYGGGLYNEYTSNPEISYCRFENNKSTSGVGGGMYNNFSSPVISNSTFAANTAEAGAGMVNNNYSSPVLNNCIFTNNSALYSGGGISNSTSSSPTLNNCAFHDNSAGNQGGGMRNDNYSSPVLANCLFEGNQAVSGGGIYNHYSWLTLTNCTFTGNIATDTGGGLFNNYNSTPSLSNTILWGDTPNEIYNTFYSFSSVTYSDVQGGYLGEGNIMVDPRFVDALNGDYHLSPYSVCIEAGSNAAPNLPDYDFEGDPRILDGNGDGTAVVDMGMDEVYFVPTPPEIFYVDQEASGANDGTSWSDAFTTLQPALDIAADGDQIWVAAGTYLPTHEYSSGDPRSASFQMKNGVAIYGGFAGIESNLDERDWVANVTILSGDLNGDDELGFVNNAENSYHVFYHPEGIALNRTAIMDGFTIIAGNANGAYPHHQGGGMLNISAYPILVNCIFSNNAAWTGGGMANLGSSPTLTGVTFTGNSAGYDGGGMYNSGISSPTLTNFTFDGNSAGNQGGGISNQYSTTPVMTNGTFSNNTASYGGGMHNSSSNPSLTNCIFSVNIATTYGGGIYNQSSAPWMTGCTISGNSAATDGGGMYNSGGSSPNLTDCTFSGNAAIGGNGGGMLNIGASPSLTNITFSGNLAGSLGGGMYNYDYASPEVKSCVFSGNSAESGGGMYNYKSSNPKLTNTTFTGNSAELGGAIYNDAATPVITNCTFFGNTANFTGGGMYNVAYPAPVVANSILWGDTPDEIYNSASVPAVSYSDVEGGYAGNSNLDVDPLFVDPVNSDFHIAPDSPVIDVGTNSAPNLPEYDFEGDPRILDGNGDWNFIVDMGVDEYNPESFARFESTLDPVTGWQPDKPRLALSRGPYIALLAVTGLGAALQKPVRQRLSRAAILRKVKPARNAKSD
jgi:predicted outer membrane repeat protein